MIFYYAAVLFFCVLISAFDLKYLLIPDFLLISFLIVSIGFYFFLDKKLILPLVLSGLLFFFIFFLIYRLTNGLGFGDVKFVACLAFAMGFYKSVFAFFCASLLGLVFFLLVHVFNKKIKRIPFAPFLTASSMVSLFLWRCI